MSTTIPTTEQDGDDEQSYLLESAENYDWLSEMFQYLHDHPGDIEEAVETGVLEVDVEAVKGLSEGLLYNAFRTDETDAVRRWFEMASTKDALWGDASEFLASLHHGEPTENPPTETPDDLPEIEWTNLPDEMCISIGKANPDQYGKLVAIEGLCNQTSDQNPRLVAAEYRCQKCGQRAGREVDATGIFKIENVDELEECMECGSNSLQLSVEDSHFEEYQQLRVQEPADDAEDPQEPATTKVELLGDSVEIGEVSGGDRVTILGHLDHFEEKGTTVLETYIDATEITPDDSTFEAIELTDTDVEEIKEFAQKDDAFDVFCNNIAEHIVGHEDEKKAIALQLVGGRTIQNGDSREGGEINILFIGTPSTGKSDLIKAAHELAPHSNLTSGTGATGVGLTATAKEEEIAGESSWVAKAGPVVLSDNGLICIDEFDKIHDDDKSKLNDALQKGKVFVTKADINTTMNARVSALVAANPKGGDFDLQHLEDGGVIEQFNLTPDLLSRFDLKFPFFDRPDKEQDSDIADNMMDNYSEEGVQVDEALDKEFMRKYVAYARQNVQPTRTDEAKELLKEFWMFYRDDLSNNQTGATAVDTRQLKSLMKLADASARFRLSDTVELEDAKRANSMVAKTLDQMHKNQSGEIDSSSFMKHWTKKQKQKQEDENDSTGEN